MNDEETAGEDEGELGEVVLAYVETFSERVAAKMLDAASPAEAVSAFVAELKSDGGLMQLLGSAFEDGRRDAMLSAARFVEDEGPGTGWDGVDGGERLAMWRESHACNTCSHAEVCIVQRTTPAEMLVQIRRCLSYVARHV